MASLLLLLALFTSGTWYAAARHPPNDAGHLQNLSTAGNAILAEVTSVKTREDRITTTAELSALAIMHDSLHRPAHGKLLAYLPATGVRVGDVLLLASDIDTVAAPLNPEVFDYRAHLASQNIFHRSFVDSGEYVVVSDAAGLSLLTIGERSRDFWFTSLTPYLDGDALAVAAALIMGKRDLLQPEVRSAYADTGAIHVLAVSGLHVGILALIVSQLLGWVLPHRGVFLVVRTLATVTAVWYFALITGLSPSVQRAALMVTVVLIGKRISRNNSIYNLLAIAALVMLVVEPKQLFQVGFQLSFAAVVGIALFARRIQRTVYLPGKLHLAWDAISVSTAAQLGTLPLSLYYFGQFPVYFMLSGTLVIVFAYGVLALGLLHGLLATLGLNGTALLPTGTLLDWLVGLQNDFIFYCRQLPGATLQLTDIGWVSVIGLYGVIAALAYLAFRPSHRGRWVLMGTVGTLACFWLLAPALSPPSAQLIIYHIPYATAIDVYDGRRVISLGDSLTEEQLYYNVSPFRQTLGVNVDGPLSLDRDTSAAAVTVRSPLLRLLDRTVLLPKAGGEYAAVPGVDLVLVRGGLRPDRARLPEGVTIVVDGSNAPYVGRMWREAFGDRVWVTGIDGAYRLSRP